MSETYNFSEIEKKWQKYWDKNGTYKTAERDKRPKYYCLVMFPYPSGQLHMGHVRNYSIGDVFARFYRMKGHQVLHPIGWDAFGMPAENAAIKNKIHPEKWTRDNIKHMTMQLKLLGISYDWSREFATCDKEYYRWNQWFFIKMWEKGLAFRKRARVNWCPSCQTVLANEQVNQGLCWRCDSVVADKELEQWFFKITDYADELLSGHELIKDGWPQEVLLMQKNWIGKSIGAEVDFEILDESGSYKSNLRIFTTRPDTLFGATFMVLAPEHEIFEELQNKIKNWDRVHKYIHEECQKTTPDRAQEKEKTGVKLEGVWAINPVNKTKIPIFAADYVLMGYGTGAIMAVPGHDQRDWEFAKKFNVPIIEVIHSPETNLDRSAYEGEGVIVNSGQFNGIPSTEAKEKVTLWLESQKLGKKSVNFRLKDWLLSRQRYWGTPIPMIHCDKCGIVPVPEKDLPVVLPINVKLTGTGHSPLGEVKEFVNVKCPKCGSKARRETDTMDTFVDSSWYFARYCDPQNNKEPFSKALANAWLPVDQYIGGIEHACMHLIYARFWHKIMRDLGLLKSDEPFGRLLTQGMVTLGGSAMSKSKGNIVVPDEIVKKYGADTARLFVLFAAPPEKQLDWSDEGVEGSWRFLNRIWRLLEKLEISSKPKVYEDPQKAEAEKKLLRSMHYAIKKVTNDIEKEKQLNTAISAVMELVNAIYAYQFSGDILSRKAFETAIILLSPFTPHICEELWETTGHKESISDASWPKADEKYIAEDTIDLPVQINGRLSILMF
ncbi:MAG: leucine--tRNA ligase [Elusimicrobia bacterium]|nr:leucine--tRNA ligase [Elusimicrobiota bacterium]